MEVLERIANHEFAGELREIVEALIPLRRDRWETEDYLRATLMSGDGKDLHKEALRDSLLEAICGNDKYTFGYAYYFLGSWKNRTSGDVVIEDAFCYANEASVNYSLWCEEQTTAIEQADNGCKADLALKAMQSPIHVCMDKDHELKKMFDIQMHNILQYYPKDCLLQQKPATKANSPQTIPQELNTDRARAIFAKAVDAGLMSKDYEWLGTASLYGYFVDRVSKELDITTGAGRIRWVLFKKTIVNHDTIVSTAKQAISDYKNKNLPPPNGDDIVDKIIKETR